MDYIKKEFKKLGSICLILIGSFLLIEHIYTYGRIDLLDILGHEWFGILFIISGILWANNWGGMTFKDAKNDAIAKLKYVFNK